MKGKIEILEKGQRLFWGEAKRIPPHFVLFGGTAVALRYGHRVSEDFDFFTKEKVDPNYLINELPFAKEAKVLQNEGETLSLRIERNGTPVKISFFGNINFADTKHS